MHTTTLWPKRIAEDTIVIISTLISVKQVPWFAFRIFRNFRLPFRWACSRQLYLVDICSDKEFDVAAGAHWPLLAGQLVVQLKMLALLLPLLLVVAEAAPASASASGTLPSCENALPPGEGFGGSVVITSDCIWRPQLHFINTLTGEQRPDYAGALEAPTIFYEPAAVTSQSGVWDMGTPLLGCCLFPAAVVCRLATSSDDCAHCCACCYALQQPPRYLICHRDVINQYKCWYQGSTGKPWQLLTVDSVPLCLAAMLVVMQAQHACHWSMWCWRISHSAAPASMVHPCCGPRACCSRACSQAAQPPGGFT